VETIIARVAEVQSVLLSKSCAKTYSTYKTTAHVACENLAPFYAENESNAEFDSLLNGSSRYTSYQRKQNLYLDYAWLPLEEFSGKYVER
jgi:hypothetical protein